MGKFSYLPFLSRLTLSYSSMTLETLSNGICYKTKEATMMVWALNLFMVSFFLMNVYIICNVFTNTHVYPK